MQTERERDVKTLDSSKEAEYFQAINKPFKMNRERDGKCVHANQIKLTHLPKNMNRIRVFSSYSMIVVVFGVVPLLLLLLLFFFFFFHSIPNFQSKWLKSESNNNARHLAWYAIRNIVCLFLSLVRHAMPCSHSIQLVFGCAILSTHLCLYKSNGVHAQVRIRHNQTREIHKIYDDEHRNI